MRKAKAGVNKSKYFRRVTETFHFEDWMIAGSDHTTHALGAAFMLAGIEDGEYIRISAAQQRVLFGSVLIGKKAITLDEGRFIVIQSQSYDGGDYDTYELTDLMHSEKLRRANNG